MQPLDERSPRPSPELERLAKGPAMTTMESWRGAALPLELSPADLDPGDVLVRTKYSILDHYGEPSPIVLCVYPEMRIVAFLGQLARARNLAYPVLESKQLARALGEDRLELVEHRIDAEEIMRQVRPEWFPIHNEGELLSAIHRALVTCSSRAAQARTRGLGGIATPTM